MPVAASLYYFVHQRGDAEKPPVVLIHGAGGTHLYWPPEIRRLPGYRVFAPDLPGHGKSGGRGMQTISAYANSILDWLEKVNLHRAVFVGHSMGSAIVLTLALDYPGQVIGLGLVSASARLRVHPDILQNAASDETFLNAVELVIHNGFSEKAPPRLVELAARRMTETRRSVFHGDFMSCDTFDVIERVSGISRPTLVICGIEDKMTPLRYAQFLAEKIPRARLTVIPEAGHMVQLEKPGEVAEVLRDYLDGIPF